MEDAQAARATELILGQLSASAQGKKKVLLVFPRMNDLVLQRERGTSAASFSSALGPDETAGLDRH